MPRIKKIRVAWASGVLKCAAVAAEISGPWRPNASTLAHQLNMSERTITRVIRELRALGAPLPYQPGAKWLEFERPWCFWTALRQKVEAEIARADAARGKAIFQAIALEPREIALELAPFAGQLPSEAPGIPPAPMPTVAEMSPEQAALPEPPPCAEVETVEFEDDMEEDQDEPLPLVAKIGAEPEVEDVPSGAVW